jgi:hypothetical protein
VGDDEIDGAVEDAEIRVVLHDPFARVEHAVHGGAGDDAALKLQRRHHHIAQRLQRRIARRQQIAAKASIAPGRALVIRL